MGVHNQQTDTRATMTVEMHGLSHELPWTPYYYWIVAFSGRAIPSMIWNSSR
jgi:hypothetical protein